MQKKGRQPAKINHPSSAQHLFVRYFTAILVDLTVLNLFEEYWDFVTIQSFTVSLFVAILLQLLLKITLKIEHRIGDYFKSKPGKRAVVMRYLSAWAVLFGSKFVIFEAINFAFGEWVVFSGPLHGIVAFITVIVVMLVAEFVCVKTFKSLGSK